MPPKTPYDTNALIKQTQDMLKQTAAQGTTAFAGSSYDTNRTGAVQAITPSALTTETAINLPTKPVPTVPDITGGNATITANMGSFATPTEAPKETGVQSEFQRLMESISPPPPSVSSQYQSDYASAGIDAKQGDVNARKAEQAVAKQRLDALNAQLAGITAEAQAIPIRLQQEATGQGITAGGLAPIQTAQLRNNALKAIPVQAQVLGAQADLAFAQGNTALSQEILGQANERLNTLFQVHQKDAENQYNYKKELRERAYDYMTAQQKTKADALQKADDRKFQMTRDAIDNQQALSRIALETNQGSLAGKIAALDPNSPTFNTDLAKLQSQIQQQVAAVVAKEREAPTVKTINGVDMQWNSASGRWEEIASGMSGGTPENIRKGQDATNLVLKTIKNLENTELTDASGRSTGRKLVQGFFYGQGDYGDLVAETNTLRTNMLVMQTDPSIKKFFGPQMSNADVQLMTSAGTTLNPELQSPAKLKEEVTRIKDLTIRASMAVQGVSQYATTPSGVRVGMFPDGTIKDIDGNLYNADGKRI